ncbi:MAG: bifunctional diaminohydroxyphosphoribosylaminopyrimidine deaminase/5-amino-6-(5-phosphoribosylamino)uracil reductase RibD [Motiliproteus sp.]
MSFSADDHRYMARALQLAASGLYTTEPNPRVGCVLVKDGVIVGEGFHLRAGEGHAEVNALAMAGDKAQGATAYVTLEPCSHQGKTPPCCDALMKAGVNAVISALQDPNPLVSGRGHNRLQQAGIKVRWGLMQHQAEALNPGFIQRMTDNRPYVRIKQAISLDGRTAMASGESKWITGSQARSDVQRLRARSSAILTGIGTVLHDDPSMALRAEQLGLSQEQANEALKRQPLRVILDRKLRTPPSAAIINQPGETVIFYTDADDACIAALNAKATLIAMNDIEPLAVLQWLARERECNELLIEAGAQVGGSFIAAGLVDELVIYQAPTLLGSAARPAFALPLEQMAQQQRLQRIGSRQLGDDMRFNYSFVKSSGATSAGDNSAAEAG